MSVFFLLQDKYTHIKMDNKSLEKNRYNFTLKKGAALATLCILKCIAKTESLLFLFKLHTGILYSDTELNTYTQTQGT